MRFEKLWSFALVIALAVAFAGCEKTPEQKLIKGIKNDDVLMVQQALSEDVKLPEAKGFRWWNFCWTKVPLRTPKSNGKPH